MFTPYKIIKKYSQKLSDIETVNIFYEIESELDNIFFISSDLMTALLRVKWWETKLIEIQDQNIKDSHPILKKIQELFDNNQIDSLINFIDSKIYEAERYEFIDHHMIIQNYFEKIGKTKSLIILNNTDLTSLMTCFEILKFLSWKSLYSDKNWNFDNKIIDNLIVYLKSNFQIIEYKNFSMIEKLYYQSVKILIQSIKNHDIKIKENYFRVKLSFAMLFA
jgi:hypothetical protein